jgi:hypothetical protein
MDYTQHNQSLLDQMGPDTPKRWAWAIKNPDGTYFRLYSKYQTKKFFEENPSAMVTHCLQRCNTLTGNDGE